MKIITNTLEVNKRLKCVIKKIDVQIQINVSNFKKENSNLRRILRKNVYIMVLRF
jgi:hypothetical protein